MKVASPVGKLTKKPNGRFALVDFEFTSFDPVDLLIEGQWIKGNIEFWNDAYYWFSRTDGVVVVLCSGLTVRISERRYSTH